MAGDSCCIQTISQLSGAACHSSIMLKQGLTLSTQLLSQCSQRDFTYLLLPLPHPLCPAHLSASINLAWPKGARKFGCTLSFRHASQHTPFFVAQQHADPIQLSHFSCRIVQIGIFPGDMAKICPHTSTGRADYFGPAVNRAARLLCAAKAGQILVSYLFLLACVLLHKGRLQANHLHALVVEA